MSRHVVFGAGQVGRHLVAQLVASGVDTIAASRSGRPIAGATVVAGDARDATFTSAVCRGADVVYCCLNAGDYRRWPQEFPPLQDGVVAGAAAVGARLVVLENLYAYGSTGERDLVETLPVNPSSAKAAARAAMTDALLAAHRAGHVDVAIGRASDYFGPGTTQSALGTAVFDAIRHGRRAQVMGDPDLPHSYSYTPDVAAALITLGSAPAAAGEVWHLPIEATRSTRDVVGRIGDVTGTTPRLFAAGALTLRLGGLVMPALREYRHTLYQFQQRWVVDDRKFRAAFDDVSVTPLDDALVATAEWFRTAVDPVTTTHEGALS